MWCSQSAMPCSGGAELSSTTWAPISLCKLSGPAMFESSCWGQRPRWGYIWDTAHRRCTTRSWRFDHNTPCPASCITLKAATL
jgi:hypothetical protein